MARATLGGIDLDPASDEVANRTIRASRYYSAQGRDLPWHGRVFCNPPGGPNADGMKDYHATKSQASAWWIHAMREGLEGRLRALFWVAFNIEQLTATQAAAARAGVPSPFDFAVRIPSRRIAYTSPRGKAATPPHSSALFCVGCPDMIRRFHETTAPLGGVVVGRLAR